VRLEKENKKYFVEPKKRLKLVPKPMGYKSELNLLKVEHLYAHFEKIYNTFQQFNFVI
jgi:hypothetical protein